MKSKQTACLLLALATFGHCHVIRRDAEIPKIQLEYGAPDSLQTSDLPVDNLNNQELPQSHQAPKFNITEGPNSQKVLLPGSPELSPHASNNGQAIVDLPSITSYTESTLSDTTVFHNVKIPVDSESVLPAETAPSSNYKPIANDEWDIAFPVDDYSDEKKAPTVDHQIVQDPQESLPLGKAAVSSNYRPIQNDEWDIAFPVDDPHQATVDPQIVEDPQESLPIGKAAVSSNYRPIQNDEWDIAFPVDEPQQATNSHSTKDSHLQGALLSEQIPNKNQTHFDSPIVPQTVENLNDTKVPTNAAPTSNYKPIPNDEWDVAFPMDDYTDEILGHSTHPEKIRVLLPFGIPELPPHAEEAAHKKDEIKEDKASEVAHNKSEGNKETSEVSPLVDEATHKKVEINEDKVPDVAYNESEASITTSNQSNGSESPVLEEQSTGKVEETTDNPNIQESSSAAAIPETTAIVLTETATSQAVVETQADEKSISAAEDIHDHRDKLIKEDLIVEEQTPESKPIKNKEEEDPKPQPVDQVSNEKEEHTSENKPVNDKKDKGSKPKPVDDHKDQLPNEKEGLPTEAKKPIKDEQEAPKPKPIDEPKDKPITEKVEGTTTSPEEDNFRHKSLLHEFKDELKNETIKMLEAKLEPIHNVSTLLHEKIQDHKDQLQKQSDEAIRKVSLNVVLPLAGKIKAQIDSVVEKVEKTDLKHSSQSNHHDLVEEYKKHTEDYHQTAVKHLQDSADNLTNTLTKKIEDHATEMAAHEKQITEFKQKAEDYHQSVVRQFELISESLTAPLASKIQKQVASLEEYQKQIDAYKKEAEKYHQTVVKELIEKTEALTALKIAETNRTQRVLQGKALKLINLLNPKEIIRSHHNKFIKNLQSKAEKFVGLKDKKKTTTTELPPTTKPTTTTVAPTKTNDTVEVHAVNARYLYPVPDAPLYVQPQRIVYNPYAAGIPVIYQ